MTTPSASLLAAAADVAGHQHFPRSALYVVATPIGNLADLTLRAIHVLALVDAVACEDTRHSAPLLARLGVDKPLLAVHEHNEREGAQTIAARLAAGERIAYVSDAGTPGVSDPGAALVRAVREAGFVCVPIPGASSAIAALSVAGDTHADRWRFVGFVPARGAERQAALLAVAQDLSAQILFEAPHRIGSLAADCALALGDRQVTIARELTKQFESIDTMPASAWPTWLAADAHRARGEFVVIVHAQAPSNEADANDTAHDRMLAILLSQLPLKQAVALAVELTGAPRNALYTRALVLKNQADLA